MAWLSALAELRAPSVEMRFGVALQQLRAELEGSQ
jgi:hypothetical protein